MKKKTNNEFILEAKLAHGDKYDYSLTEYNGVNEKIIIICKEHGQFKQIARDHKKGQNCPICSKKEKYNKIRYNLKELSLKINTIHGDKYHYYDLTVNSLKDKIKIFCDIHGEFEQRVDIHLKGEGCKSCYLEKRSVEARLTREEFIEKANLIHNNEYNYDSTYYVSCDKKVKIKCLLHGEFEQNANSHLNGRGCPICSQSKGEKEIRKHLEKNNIKFTQEKSFDGCKNIRSLPFDFYLPELNICIEYHGKQHYEPITYFGGVKRFETQQKRDKIKEIYCYNNDIQLITIKYCENINNKLLTFT